jgi:quercetin dioxygenase-like cupin family protein
MSRLAKTFASLTVAAVLAGLSYAHLAAQDTQKKGPPPPPPPKAAHVMVTPDTITWGPAPPALPPGAQAAVLEGDPTKTGLFVVRVKFPDGYRVPPHWHPTDEHVNVISGTLMAAMGAKTDEAAMQALPAGSYVKMPRKTNHYVRAKGETVVQITAMGPFEVTYVNPQDDPRKKTAQ